MTKKELTSALEMHQKSRDELKAGVGASFRLIKRAGYSVGPLIDTYDRIIESIREELQQKKH